MLENLKKSNVAYLFFSFFLAVILWAYIVGEEAVEVSKRVDLEIASSQEMSVADRSVDSVTVILSVPRGMLRLLEDQPIRVRHQIDDVKDPGKYSFNLKPQDVERPSMIVKVKQIIPERVVVTLDKVINKRLPVMPNFINEPAAGFSVDKNALEIDPNAVLVSGAQMVLDKAEFILTEPIDIMGRTRGFRKKVAVMKSLDYTVQNDTPIDMFVPIIEDSARREFKDVQIRVMHAPQMQNDIALAPDRITFTVRGSQRLLDKLDPATMLVFINVMDLDVGKFKLPVQLNLPEGVLLAETAPVIDVTIAAKTQPLPPIAPPATVPAPAGPLNTDGAAEQKANV